MGTTYFDVSIAAEDLGSLQPHCWVRDAILSYIAAREHSRRPESKTVCFIEPSALQCAVLFNDVTLLPIDDMRRATAWLVPVARYGSEDSVGGDGGHWSLLHVTTVPDGDKSRVIAQHTDSLHQSNLRCAQSTLKLFMSALNAPTCFDGGCVLDADTERLLVSGPLVATFPQQQNGYDCGAFVGMAIGTALSSDAGYLAALLGTSTSYTWSFPSTIAWRKALLQDFTK